MRSELEKWKERREGILGCVAWKGRDGSGGGGEFWRWIERESFVGDRKWGSTDSQ